MPRERWRPHRFELVALGMIACVSLVLGAAGLPVRASLSRFGALALTLLLVVVVFSSLGLAFASFILLFKRGDPLTWALSSASQLLGGVLFPVTVLPGWLERLAFFLPITHALEVLRHVLIGGASIGEMGAPLLTLAGFAVVLVPAAWLCVSWGLDRAKVVGGLAEY